VAKRAPDWKSCRQHGRNSSSRNFASIAL
jgi:hypothetical protein